MFVPNREEVSKLNNVREREGKVWVGYYRMYFTSSWAGWWFDNEDFPDLHLTEEERNTVDEITDYVADKIPKGMNWEMIEFLKKTEVPANNGRYYFFWNSKKSNFLIELTTEFGNADYPVRIYVYRDK